MYGSTMLTKSEESFIHDVARTSDHVASMAFRHFIVADVVGDHILRLELRDKIRRFLRAVGSIENERKEDVSRAMWAPPI
jgi:hypothetical protein